MTTQVHFVHLSSTVTAAMAERGETGIVLLSTVPGVSERRIARVDGFISQLYDISCVMGVNRNRAIPAPKVYTDGDFRIVNGRVEHAPFGESAMTISEPMMGMSAEDALADVLMRLQTLSSYRMTGQPENIDEVLEAANLSISNGINSVSAYPRKQQSNKVRFKWIFTYCKTREAWKADGDDMILAPIVQQFVVKDGSSQMTYAVTDTPQNRARVWNVISHVESVTQYTSYDTEVIMKVGFGIDTIGTHGKVGSEYHPFSAVLGYVNVAKSERIALALGEEVKYFVKEIKKALMWGETNPIQGVVLDRRVGEAKPHVADISKLGG